MKFHNCFVSYKKRVFRKHYLNFRDRFGVTSLLGIGGEKNCS